jgi:hypothetical protein
MKTNAQLLDEITAIMADTWLSACERRVIGTTPDGKNVVLDLQQKVCLFGPAPAEECRAVIHRAAALDVLRMTQALKASGYSNASRSNLFRAM